MICPKCQSTKNKIYNSRFTKRTNQTWRRRRCQECNFAFSTREYIEAAQYLQVVDSRSNSQPFSRANLLLSLAKACERCSEPADTAFYLLGTIEHQLLAGSREGIITVKEIIATCLQVLQRFDMSAYLAYLAAYPVIKDQRDLKKLLR